MSDDADPAQDAINQIEAAVRNAEAASAASMAESGDDGELQQCGWLMGVCHPDSSSHPDEELNKVNDRWSSEELNETSMVGQPFTLGHEPANDAGTVMREFTDKATGRKTVVVYLPPGNSSSVLTQELLKRGVTPELSMQHYHDMSIDDTNGDVNVAKTNLHIAMVMKGRRSGCVVPWASIDKMPRAQVREMNKMASELRKKASERSIAGIKSSKGVTSYSFNKSRFVNATRRSAGIASASADSAAPLKLPLLVFDALTSDAEPTSNGDGENVCAPAITSTSAALQQQTAPPRTYKHKERATRISGLVYKTPPQRRYANTTHTAPTTASPPNTTMADAASTQAAPVAPAAAAASAAAPIANTPAAAAASPMGSSNLVAPPGATLATHEDTAYDLVESLKDNVRLKGEMAELKRKLDAFMGPQPTATSAAAPVASAPVPPVANQTTPTQLAAAISSAMPAQISKMQLALASAAARQLGWDDETIKALGEATPAEFHSTQANLMQGIMSAHISFKEQVKANEAATAARFMQPNIDAPKQAPAAPTRSLADALAQVNQLTAREHTLRPTNYQIPQQPQQAPVQQNAAPAAPMGPPATAATPNFSADALNERFAKMRRMQAEQAPSRQDLPRGTSSLVTDANSVDMSKMLQKAAERMGGSTSMRDWSSSFGARYTAPLESDV